MQENTLIHPPYVLSSEMFPLDGRIGFWFIWLIRQECTNIDQLVWPHFGSWNYVRMPTDIEH